MRHDWQDVIQAAAFGAILLGASLVCSANADIPQDLPEFGAALSGDAEALFGLAERYEQGRGVEQNLEHATSLYRQAAERGHPMAQYRLGLALGTGIGVALDREEGYRWLAIARVDPTVRPLAAALMERIGLALGDAERVLMQSNIFAFTPTGAPVDSGTLAPSSPNAAEAGDEADRLLAALLGYLSGPACGAVSTTTGADNVVVASAEVLNADAVALPAAIQAGGAFDLDLVEVAPTICNTLDLVHRISVSDTQDRPILLRNESGATPSAFHEGDHIIIDMPAAPPSHYAYVDYYAHDGVVFHLLPNGTEPDNLIPPTGGLTLGEPGAGGQEWQVSSPYGNDLIVVLFSPAALPIGDRPIIEKTADYLSDLRALLDRRNGRGAIQSGYQVVRTLP